MWINLAKIATQIANMIQAIALLSGGLDSTLAIKVVLEQGIKIMALHFVTPFCRCNRCEAEQIAKKFGISLKVVALTSEYLEMLKQPKYGYGSQMNPCIDCRIMMLSKAREYMKQNGATFIITGEVLGQRPMSQQLQTLKLIEKESGLEGLILRPLSAQLLEPTIPEKLGLVDRTKLLSISGRSRREQLKLAENFQIKDYSCPAGGCLLTDPSFAVRLKDLIKYGKLDMNEVLLLKYGRHFRLNENTKLVVARNERENKILLSLVRKDDIIINTSNCPGPIGLLRAYQPRRSRVISESNSGSDTSLEFDNELILLAARITARYGDLKDKPTKLEIIRGHSSQVPIQNNYETTATENKMILTVQPLAQEEIRNYIITQNTRS